MDVHNTSSYLGGFFETQAKFYVTELSHILITAPHEPQQTLLYFLSLKLSCLFWTFHVNVTMPYRALCTWLPLC